MSAPLLQLRQVCSIEKGGLNPQAYAEECFAHYSIPAFDDGSKPVIEHGLQIKSQKTAISRGAVLVSKLNPRIPRVWYVADEQPFRRICSTEFVPFKPDTSRLSPEYLAFALRQLLTGGQITGSTSAATKSRERAKPSDIAALLIPVPALDEQQRIVDLLSRAEGIVRLRRQAQQKAAALIPAIFVDMFGDPATNPKGWPMARLGTVAVVQGGLQVTRARESLPLERPYLRVANVYRARLDLNEVKSIRLTEAEFERTRLVPGDLLFVEGHGNPQEVGRVAVWDNNVPDCTHQNHLIRARLNPERVLPEYACWLLNSAGGRQSLLRAGKTTSGLSTISVQNVKDAEVLLPPLASQSSFKRQVKAVEAIVALQDAAATKAEAAFGALLARVFTSEHPQVRHEAERVLA